MTTHHTPGPWAHETALNMGYDTPVPYEKITCPQGGYLAKAVNNGRVSDEETKANARLIASAPELLEALEAAYEELEGYAELLQEQGHTEDADAVEAVWRKARAAIAKARGAQL
jgi:hypothetical protein